jgi:hypothetical protein
VIDFTRKMAARYPHDVILVVLGAADAAAEALRLAGCFAFFGGISATG